MSLHSMRSKSTDFWLHCRPTPDIAISTTTSSTTSSYNTTFQDPARYPRILDIVDLRPLRGRHAYKASLRSALPDSLQLCWEIWVPLHFNR
jgi:hypothetical protein